MNIKAHFQDAFNLYTDSYNGDLAQPNNFVYIFPTSLRNGCVQMNGLGYIKIKKVLTLQNFITQHQTSGLYRQTRNKIKFFYEITKPSH